MANMDKHFRDKLDNYSPKAPAECWDNIELKLDKTHIPKRKVGIWYMAAASIAIIALSATLFSIFNKNNQLVNQEFIAIEEENISSTTYKNSLNNDQSDKIILSEKTNMPSESILESTNHSEIVEQKNRGSIGVIGNRVVMVEKLKPLRPHVNVTPNYPQLKFSNSGYIAQNSTGNIVEGIENKTIKSIKISDRLSVGLDFGPSYSYRYLSSSAKNQESVAYFNSVENPIQTFSGGLNLQYKIFKRLTVQTGVYYSQMGQSIGNLLVYDNKAYDLNAPTSAEKYVNSFTLSNSIGDIHVNSKYIVVDKTNIRVDINSNNNMFYDKNDPSLSQLDSKVQQSFEYIDIPLLFRYKIIDRKADLNLIAGAGISFLIGNSVILLINDAETKIGETNGIKETNFTANLGLGIELPVVNNLKFRLEPSFKYHINPLSIETEFESHPYSFAVVSGFCLSL